MEKLKVSAKNKSQESNKSIFKNGNFKTEKYTNQNKRLSRWSQQQNGGERGKKQ